MPYAKNLDTMTPEELSELISEANARIEKNKGIEIYSDFTEDPIFSKLIRDVERFFTKIDREVSREFTMKVKLKAQMSDHLYIGIEDGKVTCCVDSGIMPDIHIKDNDIDVEVIDVGPNNNDKNEMIDKEIIELAISDVIHDAAYDIAEREADENPMPENVMWSIEKNLQTTGIENKMRQLAEKYNVDIDEILDNL